MRLKTVLIAVFALVIALSAGAQAIVLIPAALRAPSSYIEVVRETDDCPKGACFVEYIILSDGQALKKQFDSPDHEKTKPSMTLRSIPFEEAQEILAAAKSFFSTPRRHSNKKKDRDTLYYFDGEELHAFTVSFDEEKPAAYDDIFKKAGEAFDKGEPDEDFYIHDYYQPATGDIEDFHVFPSGTVIFSLFSRKDVRMKATEIFGVDEATITLARKTAEKAFTEKPRLYSRCPPASGLSYAHLEIKNEGAVFKSYTCADDDGMLAALFRYIRTLKP